MDFRCDVPGGPAVCWVQKLTTNRGRSIAVVPVPHKKGGTFGCPSCAGLLAWKLPSRWKSRSRTSSDSESVGPASALRRRPSGRRKESTTAPIIVEATGAAAKPQVAATMKSTRSALSIKPGGNPGITSQNGSSFRSSPCLHRQVSASRLVPGRTLAYPHGLTGGAGMFDSNWKRGPGAP